MSVTSLWVPSVFRRCPRFLKWSHIFSGVSLRSSSSNLMTLVEPMLFLLLMPGLIFYDWKNKFVLEFKYDTQNHAKEYNECQHEIKSFACRNFCTFQKKLTFFLKRFLWILCSTLSYIVSCLFHRSCRLMTSSKRWICQVCYKRE